MCIMSLFLVPAVPNCGCVHTKLPSLSSSFYFLTGTELNMKLSPKSKRSKMSSLTSLCCRNDHLFFSVLARGQKTMMLCVSLTMTSLIRSGILSSSVSIRKFNNLDIWPISWPVPGVTNVMHLFQNKALDTSIYIKQNIFILFITELFCKSYFNTSFATR